MTSKQHQHNVKITSTQIIFLLFGASRLRTVNLNRYAHRCSHAKHGYNLSYVHELCHRLKIGDKAFTPRCYAASATIRLTHNPYSFNCLFFVNNKPTHRRHLFASGGEVPPPLPPPSKAGLLLRKPDFPPQLPVARATGNENTDRPSYVLPALIAHHFEATTPSLSAPSFCEPSTTTSP